MASGRGLVISSTMEERRGFATVLAAGLTTLLGGGCNDLSTDCELNQTCVRFAAGAGGIGGNGGLGGTTGGASDGSALGTLGDPCPEVGLPACAGHASKSKLICDGEGRWAPNSTCDGETRCDTTPGPDQGTCKPVVPGCVNAGDIVCAATKRVVCGLDLIEAEEIEQCPFACAGASCTGLCVPETIQCSGNLPQSCDPTGQWQPGQACLSTAPVCVDGQCISIPSCADLPVNCGSKGDESCCSTLLVPGGTYNRGNDPAYPATVSDFRLDRFEITVGRFRKFVDAYPGSKPLADAGAHPSIAGSGWAPAWNTNLLADKATLKTALKCDTISGPWTDSPGANEQRPMNCITWYEAFAFCAWDGGRLPAEAEWNYAAAGGSEQRSHPWPGDSLDSSYAVYDCLADGSAADNCKLTDIQSVGSRSPKGDGRWGQADLAGSVWEWNLDWYASYPLPCVNCANLIPDLKRVFRGLGWNSNWTSSTSSYRTKNVPANRFQAVGARCARQP